jgi:hypothetical protein
VSEKQGQDHVFDATQIQFGVPALLVKRLEFVLGCLARAEQRSDQELAAGQQLPHRQRVGHSRILLRRHPRRTRDWLLQLDHMIACTEPSSATEVGAATASAILLENSVHATPLEFCQQEVGSEQRIAEQHFTRLQMVEHGSQDEAFRANLEPGG